MQSIKKSVPLICLFFIFADISYSFYQHYHTPLGGDLAQIVIINPNQGDYEVLKNPLGLSDKSYSNPNRFFAHWFTSSYFKNVPLFLQHFVNPISSVYFASAIAKTTIQLLIIFILSIYITGTFKILSNNNLVAAALLTPLFQTHGFNRYMGVVDQSIVYTFFYALPFLLLLIFYLPFFLRMRNKNWSITKMEFILLLVLIPILTLSGPLIPGVILIVHLIYFLKITSTIFFNRSDHSGLLPKGEVKVILLFSIAAMFSFYSLYIGQKNVLNPVNSIGILERYGHLPIGLAKLVTTKLGLPILLLFIGINFFIIRTNSMRLHSNKLLKYYKWVFLFSIIYLILLPIGGYRVYRPNIIRYDTFLPITLALIFLFGSVAYYFIKEGSGKVQSIYVPVIIFILLIFTNADRLKSEHFECELDALQDLSQANTSPYLLKNNCTVMEWQVLNKPEKSSLNAALFHYWNITKTKVLYYQDVVNQKVIE